MERWKWEAKCTLHSGCCVPPLARMLQPAPPAAPLARPLWHRAARPVRTHAKRCENVARVEITEQPTTNSSRKQCVWCVRVRPPTGTLYKKTGSRIIPLSLRLSVSLSLCLPVALSPLLPLTLSLGLCLSPSVNFPLAPRLLVQCWGVFRVDRKTPQH